MLVVRAAWMRLVVTVVTGTWAARVNAAIEWVIVTTDVDYILLYLSLSLCLYSSSLFSL